MTPSRRSGSFVGIPGDGKIELNVVDDGRANKRDYSALPHGLAVGDRPHVDSRKLPASGSSPARVSLPNWKATLDFSREINQTHARDSRSQCGCRNALEDAYLTE